MCRRGAVSAGLPRGASRSSVHAGRRKFRHAQDAVVAMETDKVAALRAPGPHNSRLEYGRRRTNAICWYAGGVSGSVPLPRRLVCAGELLGPPHRLARVRADAVRTQQMVPQDAVPVCTSSPRCRLLCVGAAVDCYCHVLLLSIVSVSFIYPV